MDLHPVVFDPDLLRPHFRCVLLERIDRSQNENRFYYLTWQPTLLDGGAVIRMYGRKDGHRRILAPVPFASLEEAWPFIRATLRRRLRHGYQVVPYTADVMAASSLDSEAADPGPH